MPENIKIGVFVLGAIFLLVAILGGNFKIFGAEVASTISNRSLRFVASILGTTLLIITMFPPTPGSISVSRPNETPTSQPSPSPSPYRSDVKISFKFTADDSFQPKSGSHSTSQPIQPNGEFHTVFRTIKLNRNETWLWGYQYNIDGSLQVKFGKVDSNDRFVDPWVSTSEKIYYAQDSMNVNKTTISGVNNQYDWLKATAEFMPAKSVD